VANLQSHEMFAELLPFPSPMRGRSPHQYATSFLIMAQELKPGQNKPENKESRLGLALQSN
jgi:hypothetical protein